MLTSSLGCLAKQNNEVPTAALSSFDVISVRHNHGNSDSFRIQFTFDGFVARGVTLRMLLQEASGVFEDDRISGIPKSIDAETFDIDAKVDPSKVKLFEKIGLDQRRTLLQKILVDRFQLFVSRETKILPSYELQVDKKGLKIKDTRVPGVDYGNPKAIAGMVLQSRPGLFQVRGLSMTSLAQLLSQTVGRTVIDKTELPGRYDFSLRWVPDELANSSNGNIASGEEMSSQSIFTALREQLGLRLFAVKSPVDIINVVRVSEPSEN
jgi:uncharacterized protein (TIGR03435 family)